MQFSLQMALFPLHYAMRSTIGMFLFAFWPENVKPLLLVVNGWLCACQVNKYIVAHQA